MSTTPKTADDLFDEYVKDWNAALNPCMACLLERCPEDELPALNALIDYYLSSDGSCKTPPYSPVQARRLHEKMRPIFERVENDPAWMAMQDQYDAAWRDKPWWRKAWIRTRSKVMWRWITRPRPFTKQPWE